MQLYIVEKPSVGETLAGFFNKGGAKFRKDKSHYIDTDRDIIITWAAGHLLYSNAPEQYNEAWKPWKLDTLPLIPPALQKTPYTSKKELYQHIISLVKEASTVIHAGDPDREGQVIVDELLDGHLQPGTQVLRLLLSSLDDKSLSKAMSEIKDNTAFAGLYKAGNMRNFVDWLVGINATRYFTLKAREGGYTTVFNVGRVKAPTLALIVEREAQITNFKQQTYYRLSAFGVVDEGNILVAQYQPEERILDKSVVEAIKQELATTPLTITEILTDRVETAVNELYSLDTLQIDADKYYGLSGQQTLEALEALYLAKHTSYPRVDSKHLPVSQYKEHLELLPAIQKHLSDAAFPAPIPTMPKTYNDKKVTAHHAVVPTANLPELARLGENERKIYELVCARFIESFMPPEIKEKTTLKLQAGKYPFEIKLVRILQERCTLQLTGTVEKDKGEEEEKDEEQLATRAYAVGEVLTVSKYLILDGKTTPPKRYTEGSLIAAMNNIKSEDAAMNKVLRETKGIGTPATRGNIISELLESELIGKKGRYFFPTEKGIILISVLPDKIKKPDYTAELEIDLDHIEQGAFTEAELIAKTEVYIREIVSSNASIIVDKTHACPMCKEGFLHFKYFKDKETKQEKEYFKCQACATIFPAVKKKPAIKQCPLCGEGFFQSRINKVTGERFFTCSKYPTCKKSVSEAEFQILGTKKEKKCPKCKSGTFRPRNNKTTGDLYYACSNCNNTVSDEVFKTSK